MGIYDGIRTTLEYTLAHTSGLPTNIAWENVIFEPITDTSYLSTLFIPTWRRPAVRGLSPSQRLQGLFRIVVNTPQGIGPGTADDYADVILSTFNATTDLSYNSVTVPIEYAERNQGLPYPPWYRVICDIGWYYYT